MGESLIDKALRREVITTFGDPDYRPPPLPSVAIQLMSLSRNEDVELEEVVRLLEQDQVLAGIAMRIVSSSLYAGRAPVASLHQAVVRIGLKKLRSIVFEATLRGKIFDLPEYRELAERVSRHGTASAYVTRLVCQGSDVDPENGFLCGLLHDVGFSALLQSVTRGKSGGGPTLSALWQDFDSLHEQATGIVARLWGCHPRSPKSCVITIIPNDAQARRLRKSPPRSAWQMLLRSGSGPLSVGRPRASFEAPTARRTRAWPVPATS